MACSRSCLARAAHSGREVVIIPPSPVVRILRGWKDQAAISAPAPTGLPRYVEPAAQAASSMTTMPRGSHTARMPSRSTGTPPWSTAITARVFSVSAASTEAGVRLPVTGSTSAKTGRAPTYIATFAVAMNENEGRTTSSPAPTPATMSARCRPVVQLETATACSACWASANRRSNSATRGPCATHPEEMTSVTAAISSSPSQGCITLMRVTTTAPGARRRSPRAADATSRRAREALAPDRPGPRNQGPRARRRHQPAGGRRC